MNRIRLAICFIAILPGCTRLTHRSKYGEVVTYQGYITVIGSAKEDSKGGALVEMDMKHRYFIRGLTSWPENIYGKTVKVSGRCVTVDQTELFKVYPYRQGYAIKSTLRHAKWEVVN